MSVFRMRHISVGLVGAAMVALICASSMTLRAQEDKNKDKDKNKHVVTHTTTTTPPKGQTGGTGTPKGGSTLTKTDQFKVTPKGQTGGTGTPPTGGSNVTKTPQFTVTPTGQTGGQTGGTGTVPRGGLTPVKPGQFNANPTGQTGGQTGGTGTVPRGGLTPVKPGQFNANPTGQTGGTGTVQGGRPMLTQSGGTQSMRTTLPLVVRTPNGGALYRRTDGSIREIHTVSGAVIMHPPGGGAFVQVNRPGGQVMVANRAGYGYVQRPFYGGAFVQRTYFYHGTRYVNVYRPYRWGSVVFNVYTPMRFYRPAFYAWVWNPWPVPVYYASWGWGGRPWYGYYHSYFMPYPYYAGPRFWLTDFLLAAILEQAYQERVDAAVASLPPSQSAQVALTPEVKQAIADEVQRQLALERSQGQTMSQTAMVAPADNTMPPSLAGVGPHVFVVSQGLDVASVTGQPCSVTEGDVLQMVGAPSPGAGDARVVVLASKSQDCVSRSVVSVPVPALVEMQNRMRETVDQGLQNLQSRQGQGGLPTLPSDAAAPPVDAPYAGEAKADPNVADELRTTSQEAAQGEQEVVSQTTGQKGAPAAPVRIALGQTMDNVVAALGTPLETVDLGSKKIFVYKDLKITFVDGKVTDVQ